MANCSKITIRGPLSTNISAVMRCAAYSTYQLAKILHEAGYPYMLTPDHAPHHPDDVTPEGTSNRMSQAWAFQFGYITALIQAVENESSRKSEADNQ